MHLTKSQLSSQFENTKNNYIIGLAAISLMSEPFVSEHLKKSSCKFGQYTIAFEQLASLLESDANKALANKEFVNMLMRMLLKESFELVRTYSMQSNQFDKFNSQPWYHFIRLIRNCVSHNFHFTFSATDKTLLPLSWQGKVIGNDLDNTPLDVAFLGYDGVWNLYLELKNFVDCELN